MERESFEQQSSAGFKQDARNQRSLGPLRQESKRSIKERVVPRVSSDDESSMSDEECEPRAEKMLRGAKSLSTPIYTLEDIITGKFEVKLEDLQGPELDLKRYNQMPLFETEREDLELMSVLCPYKNKVTYKLMVEAASRFRPQEIDAKFKDLERFKNENYTNTKMAKQEVYYRNDIFSGVRIIVSKKYKQVEMVQADPEVQRLMIIEQVVFKGKKQKEVAYSLDCSQAHVSRVVKYFLKSGELKPSLDGNPRLKINVNWEEIKSYLEKQRVVNWSIFRSYSSLITHLKSQFSNLESLTDKSLENSLRKRLQTNSSRLTIASSTVRQENLHLLMAYYLNLLSDLIVNKQPVLFIDETSFQESNLKKTGIRIRRFPVFSASRPSNFSLNLLACVEVNRVITVQLSNKRFNTTKFLRFFRETLAYYRQNFTKKNTSIYVVLDNCAAHFHPEISKLAKEMSTVLVYLPPKTPTYNLAEFFFRFLKSAMKSEPKMSKTNLVSMVQSRISHYADDLRGVLLSGFLKEVDFEGIVSALG